MTELPDLAPRSVVKATSTVTDRQADVRAAEQAVKQAQAEIAQAVALDRERYADALDRGEPDPGREHEDAARARLAECERRASTEQLRLDRAKAALNETIVAALPAWTAALTKATIEAEERSLIVTAQLGDAVAAQTQMRSALRWVTGRAEGSPKEYVANPPQMASTLLRNQQASPHEYLTVAELLAAIRGGIEQTTLAAEQARVAEGHEGPPVLRAAS